MDDTRRALRRDEVRVLLQIDDEFLVTLEREDLVCSDAEGCFAPAMLERIRLCHSLHHDLGVNLAGLEVAMRLLETIHAERSQFIEVLEWLHRELEKTHP